MGEFIFVSNEILTIFPFAEFARSENNSYNGWWKGSGIFSSIFAAVGGFITYVTALLIGQEFFFLLIPFIFVIYSNLE